MCCLPNLISAQSQNWWRTNGNTPSTTDFLGTTNGTSILFKTNNLTRFTINANGNLIVTNFVGNGKRFLQTDANGNLMPFINGIAGQYLDGTGAWLNYNANKHLPEIPAASEV